MVDKLGLIDDKESMEKDLELLEEALGEVEMEVTNMEAIEGLIKVVERLEERFNELDKRINKLYPVKPKGFRSTILATFCTLAFFAGVSVFVSCDAASSFLNKLPGINTETPTVETPAETNLLDIPEGWQIDKTGDYSKLGWDPGFEISPMGYMITFTDSSGKAITLREGGSAVLSTDMPDAIFTEDTINLTLSGYNLLFTKK